MANSALHMTLVTLGVRNVARATAFYEGMGLVKAGFDSDSVSFFDMGGTALALFSWEDLARDAQVAPGGHGFRGVALAWNHPGRADVDTAIARAIDLGGTLVKSPAEVFWGGYSGYFADLDGHLWEVAHNPHWPLRENGAMELPAPATQHGD